MSLLSPAKSNVAKTAPKALAAAAKEEEKRLNVRLPVAKHDAFRRACMRNESDMTTEILRFIDEYISKNSR